MSTTIQKSTVLSPGMLENNRKLETALMSSLLFDEMSVSDIEGCLSCSRSKIVAYEKGEPVFFMDDKPSKVMVLLEGSVIVGRDTPDGRRIIMNTFDRPGDLFGEVYLFVNKKTYGHFAEAAEKTQILQIPKEFLFHTCGNGCAYHSKLISNTLSVLAQKADYLNERLDIMASISLRQKIAKVLLRYDLQHPGKPYTATREELAQYIAATRPSISRELMNMQDEGLIRVGREGIQIGKRNDLEDAAEL